MPPKKVPLEKGYTAEFDCINEYQWYETIKYFVDSNVYQTWAYDAVRYGREKISHFILRKDKNIIAVAQACIVRIPIIGVGAAYVRWGPLWRNRKQKDDPMIFRMAIRALRNEYVCNRGLILRIFPILLDHNSGDFYESLEKEGYKLTSNKSIGRTIIVDIQPPIEILRKNLHQKWRNCLNKAERNNLDIIQGFDDGLFIEFIGIYRELLHRKKFKEPNDIKEFRVIQRVLPIEDKMRIFIARYNGISTAGVIVTSIGDTGVYLFGATNNEGMKNNGSYLLQWNVIQWLKNDGCKYYNLNGINSIKNPGSYRFKSRLAGKNGKEINYLGFYESYPGTIYAMMVKVANLVFPFMKMIINKSILRTKT